MEEFEGKTTREDEVFFGTENADNIESVDNSESVESVENVDSSVPDSITIYVNNERWYLYQQLSYILGISIPTFYNFVKTGEIKKKKIYGITVYRR